MGFCCHTISMKFCLLTKLVLCWPLYSVKEDIFTVIQISEGADNDLRFYCNGEQLHNWKLRTMVTFLVLKKKTNTQTIAF